jgi:hypothetical protein
MTYPKHLVVLARSIKLIENSSCRFASPSPHKDRSVFSVWFLHKLGLTHRVPHNRRACAVPLPVYLGVTLVVAR